MVFILLFRPPLCSSGELTLTETAGYYELVSIVSFYEDTSKNGMSFGEIIEMDKKGLFIENGTNHLNFGFTQSSYWIKFTPVGKAAAQDGWFLEFEYPAIDLYTVYLPDEEGSYSIKKIGDSIPFKNWDVFFHRPSLYLGTALPVGQPVYIHIKSSAVMNIVPVLFRGSVYSGHTANVSLLLGLYYGIMVALIVYNFFLYLSMRDTTYLLYVCVISVYVLSQMTYNGLGYQFLWPSGGWFTNFSYVFFLSIVYVPIILFSQAFLKLKKLLPRTNFFLRIYLWIFVFLCLSALVIDMKIVSKILAVAAVFVILTIYCSAIAVFRKGLRSARFFLIAWSVFLLGLIILILKMMGVLPHNLLTEYSMQVGSAIEGLLLSLALADRINILKREKEIAQQQALEASRKSESIKTEYLKRAENLVEERTLELTKAKNKLEKLSRIDPLTDTYNRRVFDEVYHIEFSRAKRSGQALSLLIVDIDWFKKFNDRYGHRNGDECLQKVAGAIKKHSRRVTDTLARYGGEEFAVILAETDMKSAVNIAENIRAEVEALAIDHQDSASDIVTVSIGLATVNVDQNLTMDEFFEKADKALYKAKKEGRNKVCTG